MVKEIFNNCDQQEQGLRSCLGLVSLERKYTSKRLEAAYSRAVSYQACYYKSLKSFLQKGLDMLSTAESLAEKPLTPRVVVCTTNVRMAMNAHIAITKGYKSC